MKKRDLILAGALLFGMSVQAQEQLFFYGFEADETSLMGPDSLKVPVDSVKQLQYYKATDGKSGNGAYTLNDGWVLWDEPVDTALYMINGIAPLTSRGDVVTVVEAGEQHAIDFEAIGGKGGEYYLSYKADTVGGATSDCNDYEANIFVRGLPIKDNTSYRLSYYVKASAAEGHLQTDVMRGWFNSEKAFSMNGEGGPFVGTKEEFTTDRWERVTMMTYYQNDSVANHYMYKAGYWWTSGWARTFEDGETYNFIVQPDTYFARFSFRGPGVTYYVDDIALTESWIAGAEYNGQIMRVDFGYDTNMAELCEADPLKSKKLPYEYFDLVGYYYDGDDFVEEVLPIFGAEYHNDGYLYIWLDGDVTFEGLDSVGLNFRNPGADTGLQLKYDGTLYPMALDTAWVNAGKIVPNFSSEPAFYNPEISATSQDMMPPLVASVEPEAGSFTLDSNTKDIKVTFNKRTYVNLSATDSEDKGVMAILSGSGVQEFWTPSAYDDETFTVTFTRQGKYTTPLNGDYSFTVYNMRAVSFGEEGEDYNCIFSFGELGDAPKFMTKLDFAGFDKGVKEIAGLSVNVSCMMEVTNFTGLYEKALKFGLYGATNLQNGAPVLTYTFNVAEAGEWYVNYGTSGCLKNSWNDGCKMQVDVLDASGTSIYTYVEEGTNNRPSEGGAVDSVDAQSALVNFPAAGEYKVTFTLPNENSYGGGHKGGRVLYYFEVCSVQSYARAWNYIAGFNVALANAQAAIAKAEANTIYTGATLDALKAFVADNEGFISKAPSAYNEMNAAFSAEIAKMNTRISTVDAYYAAYAAAQVLVDSMKAIDGYKELAAVAAASASLEQYAALDVVPLTNEELGELTTLFNNETKAINDRCTAIANFNTALAAALAAIEDNAGTAYADFAEYKALQDAYNNNKDIAIYTVSDEDLAAATTALQNGSNGFQSTVVAVTTLTQQVKSLKELADGLEVEWGTVDAEELAAQVASETEDNQKLANVYKFAIKAQLEKMMANNEFEAIAPLAMDAFVQNSQLYTGIKGYSTPDYQGNPHNGGNAVKINEWTKTEPAKVMPGWTVEATSGNTYFYNSGVSEIASDAQLAVDWNSSITFSQELTNLPAGVYSFEIGYKADGASSLSGEIVFSQTGVDTIYTDSLKLDEASAKTVQFNYYGGDLKIKARINNTSTWSYYDSMAGLSLIEPLADFDYATAAAASAAAMGEAYTGVNAIVAPSKVEFYNLNGMQVTEPNAGVNIRISTGANGQRVVEKVLMK